MKNQKRVIYNLIIVLTVAFLSLLPVSLLGNKQASAADNSKRIKIVFWHEMTGPAQTQLNEFVKQFNKSQSKYQVVSQFEGTYEEAVQKILNTHESNTSPAVFQSADISVSQLYHSGYITKVQKFIDKDKSFNVNDISSVARAFYSQKGELLGMPFNTSQPVLYYNASLLKKYNITPPPMNPSYSDITRVAKQLYQRSNKKVKGMTMEVYGWLFDQLIANSGNYSVNNQNGRLATPTKASFINSGSLKAMEWIQENVKSGDFINYGSGTNASANEMAAFLSGKLGIFMESSADIGQLTLGMKNQKLGVTYYPHADGQKANGVAIGGAALWISNDKSSEVQQGAWNFIKYLESAKNQATWQKATGYLALNKNSKKTKTLKNLYKKNPALKVPSEQLAKTVPNNSNSGIFVEGIVQERIILNTALDQIYNGSNIKSSLTQAEEAMNSYIKNNNRANGWRY
ncbi:ABC transporter substrate-binding protein [Oenococcus oeni]|uniref:Carbohydrate ABC transporter substrate-binding protein, CUT1 family n=2 Tax=Oenococcus oeni TaxID=1247 RepID=Q04E02_OENOB|nr:ABC transporter substrate-binding protein [Oenococcus oeni]ABJ57320.1 carbohydrate ABC transporter substrate-binding protein, CUT1 family [Oenococcus oeni PSU-1]EKP88410.1 ABC-type sugar transport system, periplasmic component [Oenococcus oeni DSM 20252 = AWRIB129]KGH54674.1 glycerol-3-phosphate ABC transporter substrate-binding protein [Oenococcus oeni IOEB_S277]KGH57452.1 glycerol-3-phosphate ABC transporter substrate-binding protein [Oenococcus oeni IOEB_B10]KGH67509.1 glycerol-3-phospha